MASIRTTRLWHLFIASAIRLNSHKGTKLTQDYSQPSNARGTVGNSAVDAVAEAAKLCGSLGHHLEQASPEFDAVANGVNLSPLKHVGSIEWDNVVLWRLVYPRPEGLPPAPSPFSSSK